MIPRPNNKPVVLDGTNESDALRIPRGTQVIAIQARGTNNVRVATIDNNTQNAGGYWQLTGGQPFEFRAPTGDAFEEFDLFFYAGAAETVDVVWF